MKQQQRGSCSLSMGRSTCCGAEVSTGQPTMRLSIASTTGSPVELTVPRGETVEGLRTHISKKLRLQTDRIILLHRNRQLSTGKLLDLGVTDGSKLTLVPVIEAGLVCLTTRAERTTLEVLENLTEAQISDFLSGRTSLNINLGVGAHMMCVQLQLSAQNVVELQQNEDLRAQSSSELHPRLPTAVQMSHPESAPGSSTTPASQTSTPTPVSSNSTSPTQHTTQQPRSSFNATGFTSHPCHHHSSPCQSCPPRSTQTSSHGVSNLPSAPGCPHPCCPLQAATPVCMPGYMPASPTKDLKGDVPASPPAELGLLRQPGAVIENVVSHSPGVISGTFSGTLAPCSQSSSGISHPRSGVAIILQILNDLLRAAYHHQGAPLVLSQLHCPASTPPLSQLSAEEQSKTLTQRAEQQSKTPAEKSCPLHLTSHENEALHCKLERLQFLMHQRRLHRQTRRNSRISQMTHPYQQHSHRP